MDELCALFRKQQLLCPDENNSILKDSFSRTRDMLRKASSTTPFSHSEVQTYLVNTRERYKVYIAKIKFRRTFAYLDTMLAAIMQKIEGLLSYGGDISTEQIKEVGEILLLSFFIDCDLLFAIGAIRMDDEE